MVNEERVTELTQMAIYDLHEDKAAHQSGEYYSHDYVGKEVLKSVFSGTFAFVILFGLILFDHAEEFLNSLASANLVALGLEIAGLYVIFMAFYLLITVIVYRIRFKRGRDQLRIYYRRLKKINKLYTREEKLKE
jgi:hypothetical protein